MRLSFLFNTILLFLMTSCSELLFNAAAVRADEGELRGGIAARYVGDQGIGQDPVVIFAEDFEASSLTEIGKRWDTVKNADVMSLSDDIPSGSGGRQSLLISQLAEKGTGADLYRRLDAGHNRLYTRMYVKFADDCEPVHHFGTCVGGNYPATPWPSVRAGQPTDGSKSFWVGIEPFGERWQWDYYAYWCEMRGSPPRGQTWGNTFIHDESLMVRRGQWTFDKFVPGAEGEGVRWNHQKGDREYFQTADGGDPFEGFRFRTADQLNINFLWLYLYITKGTHGHANRVWFDDVVVATEYIGPLRQR